ncbi:MAG: MATE family efflux transporter [Oscillospiraceae bacterium]|nr:MATE family efflux transporter [Oscillospiraceae bacterium]
MAKTYDLTEGKVSKLILTFYFPMLFANLLQQVYNLADTAIVGKGLGDNALAAVGNMGSLTFLIIGFSVGLTNGFSVSIAQSYGAKDFDRLRKSIASSITLAAVITLLLTIISIIFLKSVLILLDTDPVIISDSLLYGYIIFGGLITTIAYNLCSAVLRALGDSKTPLIAIIVSSVVNVGLNCLTVFVMKTGVEGPAAATLIAQAVSAVICFAKLRKIEFLRLSASDFKADIEMYGNLMKNGIAMALMNSITAVGAMVVQYYVNGLGLAYTTAYSACMKYLNLFMDPACTAGFTMSSFASQNFGAKKYSRIMEGLKVCLSIALVTYLLFGSVMVFAPRTIAGFMLNGADTIEIAAQYLPVCGVMIFAVDFLFVFRSGVQGMGYPFIPMCSGIAEMVMRVGVIILFIGQFGFLATAYASISAWIAALLLNGIAFFVILGKKMKEEKYADTANSWLP